MRKIYLLLLFWLAFPLTGRAQTFPLVIVNSDQGAQTQGTLGVYANPNGPSNQLTRFSVGSKLVASAPLTLGTPVTGSNGTTTSSYWHVDIPGTSFPRMGYAAAGSTFSNPDCGSNYLFVNSASLAITTDAGGSASVTINGVGARIFSGQYFAVKGYRTIGAVTYYEIYLTIECSSGTGWVSGAGGSVNVGSSNGISSPSLSSSGYNGGAVDLGWMMAVQPGGLVPTYFDIYRSTNNGPAAIIKTQTQNAYTDNFLVSSNSYTYYVAARYGSCASQNSNQQVVGPLTTSCNLTASISGNTTVNCGQTIFLTANASDPNVSYNWTGPGNYANNGSSISIPNAAGSNAGNYAVTVSKNGCNSGTGQLSIAVTGCNTPVCTSYPATPTGGQSATISGMEIDLSWQPVTGAANYRIYECNGSLLGTSPTNSYQATGLLPGTRYDFKLTAVNGQGCESQLASACFSSTTMGTTTTTYTVSGRVATAAGTAIAGVTVASGNYFGVSDATGSYRIPNIPEAYSGMVSASLAGYTFSPASIPITGTNDANKNFTGTLIPGGTYNVTGKVSTANGQGLAGVKISTSPFGTIYTAITGTDGTYSIAVPAAFAGYVSAGAPGYNFDVPTNAVSPQYHTNRNFTAFATAVVPKIGISSAQVPPWQREVESFSGLIKVDRSKAAGNFWHLEIDIYLPRSSTPSYAIKYPDNTNDQQFFSTADAQLAALIANKKIVNGSRLTYNAVLGPAGATPLDVAFTGNGTRIIGSSWNKQTVVFLNNGPESIQLPLHYDPANTYQDISVTFTRVSKTASPGLNLQFLTNPPTMTITKPLNLTSGICKLDVSNSNLKDVYPGEFDYMIKAQNVIIESGRFSLVKVARWANIANLKSTRVLITVAGIYNQLEANFADLKDGDISEASQLGFSVAPYLAKRAGADCWYIAQGNINTISRNGYDIGIALDTIQARTNAEEIDIVCHSKGGLDTRAFIQDRSQGLDGTVKLFAASNVRNTLKKIIFLGTPHRGAILGSAADLALDGVFQGFWPAISAGLLPDGLRDILAERLNESGSTLSALKTHQWPSSIAYCNLTGFYRDVPFSDIWVEVSSSEDPVPGCLQLYQNYTTHSQLHRNLHLSTAGECIQQLYNLGKMDAFLRGNLSGNQSCTRNYNTFKVAVYGSTLPGASISLKSAGETAYRALGQSDEQGKMSVTLFREILLGDSLKISAAGYEMAVLPVNQQILDARKIEIGMFPGSATDHIRYPAMTLSGGDLITNVRNASFILSGANVVSYQVNSNRRQDTDFVSLALNGQGFNLDLDTGRNLIAVKLIGRHDTVTLNKTLYYYPGVLLDSLTYKVYVQPAQPANHTQLYADDAYIGELKESRSLRLLRKTTELKVSQPGYLDRVIPVRRDTSIKVTLEPYTYTSPTDSNIYNFQQRINPLYWKAISLKNTTITDNAQVSVKQIIPDLKSLALQPQSRQFIFRNQSTTITPTLKTVIALDQVETPNPDSVYLLSYSNGGYRKIVPASPGLSGYDASVQKLSFDSLRLLPGGVQSLVLVKKLAPVALDPETLTLAECQSQGIPDSMFVKDPDSLKNDLSIKPLTPGVVITNNLICFTRSAGHTGPFAFKLSFTHDFITVEKNYTVDLTPCPVIPPNAFTPNGDGVNDTWNIPELSNFSNCTVEIFVRGGGMIFHSNSYGKPWDGTYGGKPLPAGVYYYIINLKTQGYKKLSGNITLLR